MISNLCFEFRSGDSGPSIMCLSSNHFLDTSQVLGPVQTFSPFTVTATLGLSGIDLPLGNVHGKMLGNQKQDPKDIWYDNNYKFIIKLEIITNKF